jgi:hypothetical protein
VLGGARPVGAAGSDGARACGGDRGGREGGRESDGIHGKKREGLGSADFF